MGYRPSVRSRWLDIEPLKNYHILIYVKQCSKGKGSHEEKGKKSILSWPLSFLYIASQQPKHSLQPHLHLTHCELTVHIQLIMLTMLTNSPC